MTNYNAKPTRTRTGRITIYTAYIGLLTGLFNFIEACRSPEIPKQSPFIQVVVNYPKPAPTVPPPEEETCPEDTVCTDDTPVVGVGLPDSIIMVVDTVFVPVPGLEAKEIMVAENLRQMRLELDRMKVERMLEILCNSKDNLVRIVQFDSLVNLIKVKNRYDLIDELVDAARCNEHLLKRDRFIDRLNGDVTRLLRLVKNKDNKGVKDFTRNFIRMDSLSDATFLAKQNIIKEPVKRAVE